MKPNKITVKLKNNPHRYDIEIGSGKIKNAGEWARKCLAEKTKKIVIVSNPKVFKLYGEAVKNSLEKNNFEVSVWLMKDGEKYKNLRSLENALEFLGEKKISRTDAVVALGGGVVGDLAGFAAAIFLRGIAFLQIPTTLLSMIDSSVGGKTAVNTEFGKNLIGAFHQPNGVLIDSDTLKTLPRREFVAGFYEIVKQSAIADRKLFDQTAKFLERFSPAEFKKHFSDLEFVSEFEDLISSQIYFKSRIVMRDERENTGRDDDKSRKILNFGHTLAHALEKVTDYKRFKHGEAVGYGIFFAAELSKRLEILDENELNLLNDVLHRVGDLPDAGDINLEEVKEAFTFDKKVIGEALQYVLLEKIGRPCIRSSKDIPQSHIEQSLEKILRS